MRGQDAAARPDAAAGAPSTSGSAPPATASSSSKADAIWAQLKGAHAAPKAQAVNFNKLWQGFSSDPAGVGQVAARKGAPTKPTYEQELLYRSPQKPSGPEQPAQPQAGQAGSKPDAETALQIVARCVTGLKDSSQAARKKALQDVQVRPTHIATRPPRLARTPCSAPQRLRCPVPTRTRSQPPH
jgi:hypothetical protein